MTSESRRRWQERRREVVRRTSRSFALSMRALPRPMRGPVELAYLLARAGDTWADSLAIPVGVRTAALSALRAALGGDPGGLPSFPGTTTPDAVSRAELDLLDSLPVLLEELRDWPEADRLDIVAVVDELLATMVEELRVLGAGTREHPRCLPDRAALIRYTEGIAGCVGVFWTRLVARHVEGAFEGRLSDAERLGRHYGRGLQLVNVLRDIPRDLERGRVFLPAADLALAGVDPSRLDEPTTRAQAGPLIGELVTESRRGLVSGLDYAASLPPRAFALRFATALPAAIGLATLDRLESAQRDGLARQAAKIGKTQLVFAMLATALACLWPAGPKRLGAAAKRRP